MQGICIHIGADISDSVRIQITLQRERSEQMSWFGGVWPLVYVLWFFLINYYVMQFLIAITRRRGTKLEDLPLAVKIVTYVPIGWLIYRLKRREVAARLRVRQHFEAMNEQLADILTSNETGPEAFRRDALFVPDEAYAHEVYARFRDKDDRTAQIRRSLETAQAGFEQNTQDLKRLSDELRQAQENRGLLASDIQRFETMLSHEGVVDDVHVKAIESEFQSLLMLKGVTGVRVFNGALSILVKGSVEYRGTTYDKGDWELRIIPGRHRIWSREIRKGITKTWREEKGRGEYPDYRMSDGSYCFGDTQTSIDNNIVNGQVLQAIELAVTCINSVNKDDRRRIPRALKIVRD